MEIKKIMTDGQLLCLVHLITERAHVIQNRSQEPNIRQEKARLWEEIVKEFNARNPEIPRTKLQLIRAWDHIKQKVKQEFVPGKKKYTDDVEAGKKKKSGGDIDVLRAAYRIMQKKLQAAESGPVIISTFSVDSSNSTTTDPVTEASASIENVGPSNLLPSTSPHPVITFLSDPFIPTPSPSSVSTPVPAASTFTPIIFNPFPAPSTFTPIISNQFPVPSTNTSASPSTFAPIISNQFPVPSTCTSASPSTFTPIVLNTFPALSTSTSIASSPTPVSSTSTPIVSNSFPEPSTSPTPTLSTSPSATLSSSTPIVSTPFPAPSTSPSRAMSSPTPNISPVPFGSGPAESVEPRVPKRRRVQDQLFVEAKQQQRELHQLKMRCIQKKHDAEMKLLNGGYRVLQELSQNLNSFLQAGTTAFNKVAEVSVDLSESKKGVVCSKSTITDPVREAPPLTIQLPQGAPPPTSQLPQGALPLTIQLPQAAPPPTSQLPQGAPPLTSQPPPPQEASLHISQSTQGETPPPTSQPPQEAPGVSSGYNKDISSLVEGILYKLNSHLSSMVEALANDTAFVNVTLTAQGHSLQAHKVVLAAVSPYFKEVLKANLCQHPIIYLPSEITFQDLQAVINFAYKGKVTVSAQHLPSVIKAAELLKISGLSGLKVLIDPSASSLPKSAEPLSTSISSATPARLQKSTPSEGFQNSASNPATTTTTTKSTKTKKNIKKKRSSLSNQKDNNTTDVTDQGICVSQPNKRKRKSDENNETLLHQKINTDLQPLEQKTNANSSNEESVQGASCEVPVVFMEEPSLDLEDIDFPTCQDVDHLGEDDPLEDIVEVKEEPIMIEDIQ